MTKRDRTTGPEGMRLYYMLGAMLHFDQSVFTHMQGMGTLVAVPTPIFLIDHPEGKVVFETGVTGTSSPIQSATGASGCCTA